MSCDSTRPASYGMMTCLAATTAARLASGGAWPAASTSQASKRHAITTQWCHHTTKQRKIRAPLPTASMPEPSRCQNVAKIQRRRRTSQTAHLCPRRVQLLPQVSQVRAVPRPLAVALGRLSDGCVQVRLQLRRARALSRQKLLQLANLRGGGAAVGLRGRRGRAGLLPAALQTWKRAIKPEMVQCFLWISADAELA